MENYRPDEEEVLQEMRRVRRSDRRHRTGWSLLFFIVLAVAAGWFLSNRYFTLAEVRGAGMDDTLKSGNLVLCRRVGAEEKPRQGDLVLYSHGNDWQIKRVIALGGDRVVVSAEGEVRVNGDVLAEDYVTGSALDAGLQARRVNLNESELFVMGDHRGLSVDSRNADFGVIRDEDVIGIARYVVWPFYQIGELKRPAMPAQPTDSGVTP